VLATGGALLLDYLDDTLKTGDDVQRVLHLPMLGAITRIPSVTKPSDALVTLRQGKSPVTEAYRVLRTNLQFSGLKNPAGTLLVTSTQPGEGKSTTAANLAVIMAQAQKQIVLVDGDLRRPSLHRDFGVSNKVGLTSLVLDETQSLDSVLQPTALPGLRLLTSGPLPPNPAEVLGSAEMARIIERLRATSDLVIFDSPPAMVVTDAVILAGKLANTLLVVDAGRTRSDAIRRTQETLQQVGAKVLGVVLNKMSDKQASAYYYYYYHDYYAGGPRKKRRIFWIPGRGGQPSAPTTASVSAPREVTAEGEVN